MWPRFDSWTQCHMWVEFLLVLVLASRGFSLDTLGGGMSFQFLTEKRDAHFRGACLRKVS